MKGDLSTGKSIEAEAWAHDAVERLTRAARELSDSGLQVERPGQAADEILRHIREQPADLVVMRTRLVRASSVPCWAASRTAC